MKGKVSNIAAFGAFVELEGDIDGLVHISQISEDRVEKVNNTSRSATRSRCASSRSTKRRIGLSIKAANYSEEDIKKEAAAFDSAIKLGTELVGIERAFAQAAGGLLEIDLHSEFGVVS